MIIFHQVLIFMGILCREKIYVICSLLASEVCRVLISHSIGVSNFDVDKYMSTIAEETCSGYSSLFLFMIFAVPCNC